MTTTRNPADIRRILKMSKAQLIEEIERQRDERGIVTAYAGPRGFAGWSKDELQREAIDGPDWS